jgi:hypothetical protein
VGFVCVWVVVCVWLGGCGCALVCEGVLVFLCVFVLVCFLVVCLCLPSLRLVRVAFFGCVLRFRFLLCFLVRFLVF